ncbi:MAG: hypothetical protein ISQ34_01325 [Rickettsiales bacterium]|nr:hypothetical protein [Rickettsiales bacterium]
MRSIFVAIISLLLVASCSGRKESPVIYFSNISTQPISDITCIWVGNKKLTLPHLYPGDSRGQSFFINDNADFFGPVYISWRNQQGRKVIREFDFKKNNLPSIENERSYDYVQFYFEQDWMEIVSSDAPDLSYKMVRMDKILRDVKRERNIRKPNSSLIRVEDRKDSNISRRRAGW